ncbi:MAG TPA: GYF domain-containing protein [Desulfuromonadaceae bacterium]|nr:GYF domain-containing protein [Desulfuromonadaceae bacterium]
MYKIIGTDGRQYGPVSADELRQWITENRVNAKTLIQAENRADWKPLGTFPEFSGLVTDVPPLASPPPSGVNPRASNKVVAGVLGILLGSFGIHKFILGYSGAGGIMLAVTLASIVGGVLTCGILFPAYAIMHIIGLVEGIIYLTKSDDEFVRTYVDNRREWF